MNMGLDMYAFSVKKENVIDTLEKMKNTAQMNLMKTTLMI